MEYNNNYLYNHSLLSDGAPHIVIVPLASERRREERDGGRKGPEGVGYREGEKEWSRHIIISYMYMYIIMRPTTWQTSRSRDFAIRLP